MANQQLNTLDINTDEILVDHTVNARDASEGKKGLTYNKRTRKDSEDTNVSSLKESIKDVGLLSPVLVRPMSVAEMKAHPGKRYALVSGFRRMEAVSALKWATVPARVLLSGDDGTSATVVNLIENLQREDLKPHEVAKGLRALKEVHGMSYEEMGKKVGLSKSYCGNLVNLCINLHPSIWEAFCSGGISNKDGKNITQADYLRVVKVKDLDQQWDMWECDVLEVRQRPGSEDTSADEEGGNEPANPPKTSQKRADVEACLQAVREWKAAAKRGESKKYPEVELRGMEKALKWVLKMRDTSPVAMSTPKSAQE